MSYSRIEYIDAIRGFAVFLMVVGHAIAWAFPDYRTVVLYDYSQSANIKVAGVIWQLIYSFHMPLLFLVSGFLCKIESASIGIAESFSSLFSFVYKKIKRILIPYFVTGFLMIIFRGYYGYWFLSSLFILQLIYSLFWWLSKYLNKENYILVDCLIVTAICIISPLILKSHYLKNPVYDFGKSANYIIPFFVGVILSKHDIIKTFVEANMYLWMVLFIALFVTRYHYNFIQYQSGICDVLGVIGSFLVWSYFAKNCDEHSHNSLKFIGRNTLEIYILHVFFIFNVVQIGEWWLTCNPFLCISSQLVYAVLQSLVAIILSVYIAKFLKKSKTVSFLMFGTQL